jgi:signal transduction histidine kinase
MPSGWRALLWLPAQALVLLIAATPLLRDSAPRVGLELASAHMVVPPHERVTLPDDWRQRGVAAAALEYETTFSLDAAPVAPWAVLISSVRMRASVEVNGERLLRLESSGESAARMWFRPLLFAVPERLLVPGENLVRISVGAEPERGYLAAPLVAPLATLAPIAREQAFWRPTLLTIILIAMAGVGALMLLLWSHRRNDHVYAFYGLGMLSWALHDLGFVVDEPPLPERIFEPLSYLALGGFIAATTFFIHRYLDERHARLERSVLAFFVVGGAVLFVLPSGALRAYSDNVWHPVILSVGLYLYLRMYVAAWRRADASLHVLAMTGSVMVLYGAHDSLIMLGASPWGNGFLLPYSAAPSLVIFSSLLARRFARSLTEIEAARHDLDRRIAEATREIEINHARLGELERQRSLSDERERVARDIHDGVGGQLVALLARVKRGHYSPRDAEAALSEALQDLRLVIESLDVAEGDLGTALATWRHRLERRLAGTRVRLVWQPQDLSRRSGLGPSDILNVLRLLDEAATNALRHGDARTLTVAYGMIGEALCLTLTDDGHGGAVEQTHGHGLKNMRRRAESVGGTLAIESGPAGTTIRLTIGPRD